MYFCCYWICYPLQYITKFHSFVFRWSVSSRDYMYSSFKIYRETVKKFFFFFRSKEELEIYIRLYLVGCALHAVKHSLKKERLQAEKLISCLMMYFTAINYSFSPFLKREVFYMHYLFFLISCIYSINALKKLTN